MFYVCRIRTNEEFVEFMIALVLYVGDNALVFRGVFGIWKQSKCRNLLKIFCMHFLRTINTSATNLLKDARYELCKVQCWLVI